MTVGETDEVPDKVDVMLSRSAIVDVISHKRESRRPGLNGGTRG